MFSGKKMCKFSEIPLLWLTDLSLFHLSQNISVSTSLEKIINMDTQKTSLSKNVILANRSHEEPPSKNGFFECFFKVGHKVFSRLALPGRGSKEPIYEATTFFTTFS